MTNQVWQRVRPYHARQLAHSWNMIGTIGVHQCTAQHTRLRVALPHMMHTHRQARPGSGCGHVTEALYLQLKQGADEVDCCMCGRSAGSLADFLHAAQPDYVAALPMQ